MGCHGERRDGIWETLTAGAIVKSIAVLLLLSVGLNAAFGQAATSGEIAAKINDAAKLPPADQIAELKKVLARARELKDRDGESSVLLYSALAHFALKAYKDAEPELLQALAITKETGDKNEQGTALLLLNAVNDALFRPRVALDYAAQAKVVFAGLGDKPQTAMAVMAVGTEDEYLGRRKEALAAFTDALADFKELKSDEKVAQMLTRIGILHSELGHFDLAKSNLEGALDMWSSQGDVPSVARVLGNLGALYMSSNDSAKAFDYYNRALKLAREAKDQRIEAVALGNMAHAYDDLAQRAKAKDLYIKALSIYEQIDDPRDLATTLNNLATLYSEMDSEDRAIQALQLALKADEEAGDDLGEASIYNNLGVIAHDTGRPNDAIKFYKQAISMAHEGGDPFGESTSLLSLGSVYIEEKQFDEAAQVLKSALQLELKSGDRLDEVATLSNLGALAYAQKDVTAAIGYYSHSVTLARQIGDRDAEAVTLLNLAQVSYSEHFQGLCILQLKLAVNIYQSIRKDSAGVGAETEASYKSKVAGVYRLLALFLGRAGRLSEAESVIGLLKDEEYFKFLNTRAAATSQSVDLTQLEQTWIGKYETIFKDFGAINEEYATLSALDPGKLTPQQVARMKEINTQFESENKAVNEYFESAETAFTKADASTERLADLQAATGLTDTLKALPNHPAAVYTMITEDGVHLLVNLPSGSVFRNPVKNINAKELSLKVLEFRQALQDPRVDPRPLGAELYDLLVRPIEPDLESGKVGTIMWSLDSWLRYIPMWALYDSKAGKYLIEKYPSSIFTPRTLDKQTHDVHPAAWSGVEFGVSQARTVGALSFPSLPGVPNELKSVAGEIGGQPKLDMAFTKDAFEEALGLKPKVVHIATHFNFIPGDDKDSFLLLGEGAMSVEEFKALRNGSLNGVELFVLSACNTAGGDTKSDGGEFESFALLAQLKGADAVMATLWPVSDASTAALMGEFYKLRKAHPEWTKLEALRQAQLEMVHGTLGGPSDANRGGALNPSGGRGQPAWTGKGFSHPFYWAPFELVGNWK
jgi:CHAT domain-containing protein/Tfp pilus assembly protein PilF